MKRKALPKGVRFDVFKRDKFTCQYCGVKAPEAILHVDHITPVAAGGTNDVMNLITACYDCNLGKGAKQLADNSVAEKRRKQADELQDRRELIEMMNEWHKGLVELEEQALERACEYYSKLLRGWCLTPSGRVDLRKHVNRYGVDVVMSVMRSTLPQAEVEPDGSITKESAIKAHEALFRKLKWKHYNDSDPDGSQLRYIRGIMRNRFNYVPMVHALDLLRMAYSAGVSIPELKDLAIDARNFTQFEREVELRIDALSGGDS